MTIPISIQLIDGGNIPEYKTLGAAGFDFYAIEDAIIFPYSRAGKGKTIRTGVMVEIPEGYEIQMRGRSGLAFNDDILAHVGTIDCDYRGEIRVKLWNLGEKEIYIKSGDRIAQGVLAAVAKANFVLVDKLGETERGAGGYGSTGS